MRNRILAIFGSITIILFIIMGIISLFDSRSVLNIPLWYKPMKFSISIAIFSWTMAWILFYLPQTRKSSTISWTIVIVLSIEIIIITFQAARGELSHFNVSSLFNGVLFQVMGIAIVINSAMVGWALVLFSKVSTLPLAYKRGIQIGFIIFLLASLEGFIMVSRLSHTIGAPDGQDGLFFLNWAKSYGDLRIAHFLGLHALQVVPVFAWYFARSNLKIVYVFGFVYFLLSLGTLWNALAGLGYGFI